MSGTASLAGTVNAIFAPGTYGLVRSYTILTAGLRNGLPTDFQASLTYPDNRAVLLVAFRAAMSTSGGASLHMTELPFANGFLN